MKKEHAQKIVDHIQNEFGEEASLYEGYSGRFMFGKETTGVVAGSTEVIHRAMGELKIRCRTNQDNMGLDYIVY